MNRYYYLHKETKDLYRSTEPLRIGELWPLYVERFCAAKEVWILLPKTNVNLMKNDLEEVSKDHATLLAQYII